ncbi:MAG: hypothetical protein NW216_01385 [Hyphomicrobium sp.]|nr:hypothetical protein [Hyphomicrobium sp.]
MTAMTAIAIRDGTKGGWTVDPHPASPNVVNALRHRGDVRV